MRTIAITSGKGGVGKTTLAANLGVALTELGSNTVVFDADLALSNLEIVLGVRAEFSLQHVVTEEKTLKEVIQRGPSGVGFVAGGSGIPMLMRSGPKKLAMFFEQAQSLESEVDFLIFDTSAGLDNKVMAFAKNSDEVIVVVTPDPSSMTDAYATIKTVFRLKKLSQVGVVVNMVKSRDEGQKVFEVLANITKDFIKKEISYLGCVRSDEFVSTSSKQRKPFVMSKGENPAKADLKAVAVALMSDGEALEKSA